MLATGDVRVNGRRAFKGTFVRPGDEVDIRTLPAPGKILVATPGTLPILYLDDDMVAVDKPPGLGSVAGADGRACVASILLTRFPEMAQIDRRRSAGLVHRIDMGTSGLLLAARHPDAYRRLRREFESKRLEKEYLAVVCGRLSKPGRVTLPLRRRAHNRNRMVPARPGARGWRAVTGFEPIQTTGDLTLVHLRMRTGVTHQLRVHMATLGHPVLGDQLYGPRTGSKVEQPRHTFGWHYLHALALRFDAPDLPRRLQTPFPAHWLLLFEQLGWPAEGSQ